MIASLNGIITYKSTDAITIDVQGVGYRVETSTQTFEQLPKEGEEVKLLVHHHITDNDQRLFGFASSDEKQLFELLVTVKGVGPKLGLSILSGLPADQIIEALAQSDKAALSQITGIGKKTAERMILELKDKIMDLSAEASFSGSPSSASGNLRQEAISALQSLGFRKSDARDAVVAATKDNGFDGDVKELVKKALTHLNN